MSQYETTPAPQTGPSALEPARSVGTAEAGSGPAPVGGGRCGWRSIALRYGFGLASRPEGWAQGRGWLMRRALLGADLAGLLVSFVVAQALWWSQTPGVSPAAEALLFVFVTLPAWVGAAKLSGLYDRDEEGVRSAADDAAAVAGLVTAGTWLFYVVSFASGLASPELGKVVAFWALAIGSVLLLRVGARSLCRRSSLYPQRTIIVGTGPKGCQLAAKLVKYPEHGVTFLGFVDRAERGESGGGAGDTVLGRTDELLELVARLDVERVIVADPLHGELELSLLRELRRREVKVDVAPRYPELLVPGARVHGIAGFGLVSLPRARLSRSSRLAKRGFDVTLAALACLCLLPLLLALGFVLVLDSRGPVFYRHRRVGRGREPIEVFKFRTMRRESCRGVRYGGALAESEFERLLADPRRGRELEERFKLADDPRVTRFGRILRRTSLDELPQLLNVLRGELSLVGPRPVTEDELARYGSEAELLLSIPPGITGYWQVSGRSSLTYEERIALDLAYVANWSLNLDLRILLGTIGVLTTRRGSF